MRSLFFCCVLLLMQACSQKDCSEIPTHFDSYEDAVSFVKNAHFAFKEEVNTSKSSWIRAASYYSCDGKTGFFIFSTDKQEYIHRDMPIEIWNEFKNAESFGKYYNANIKHKYHFEL
ncbi:MAG: hypothetical protein C5B59_00945 [Bacteroidetes bacterium]|nr:MAG: hypothetical protein C5B59_00945 [Bacteroidota bacterium]